jgi:hypothetical protein
VRRAAYRCTTAGEITTSEPSDAGVVVAAFGGEGFAGETAVPGVAHAPGRLVVEPCRSRSSKIGACGSSA